jgi:hypothetical protein
MCDDIFERCVCARVKKGESDTGSLKHLRNSFNEFKNKIEKGDNICFNQGLYTLNSMLAQANCLTENYQSAVFLRDEITDFKTYYVSVVKLTRDP